MSHVGDASFAPNAKTTEQRSAQVNFAPNAKTTEQRSAQVNKRWRTAWLAVLAVLAGLALIKHLAGIGIGGRWGYTAIAALQLYLPLALTSRRDHPNAFLGLQTRGLLDELRVVLLLCAIAFPLFAVGHHIYQTFFFGRTFALRMPEGIFDMMLTHTVAVALPEELFYRGYLQATLEERWAPQQRCLGVKVGIAAVVTAALFALGHFLGEYNIVRLGPFFPALLFAWLRNRRGSLWGAVLFHALANILGQVLFTFYT